ncbi:TRAP transporter small permease [Anaerobacillus sp. MEB173]|uniref:TRAP transporter small permease n=1 Tax=Anaerobacillus sp. MEB173 TaxID=3383345 RepID=UPI003F8E9380
MVDKLEQQLGKISDGLNKVSKVLLGIIVGSMFLIILSQVVLRYVFGSGFSWAEEVTVFLMAWMTFIGSAIAVKQAGHINIDIFIDRLSLKLRWIVVFVSKLLILAFILIFTYYGYLFAVGSFNFNSNVLRIPLFWPRFCITVAGVMMVIHMVHSLLKDIKEVKGR